MMTTAIMTQKRKRDKAHDHLRSRMRQRKDGHDASPAMLQARRRYSLRDARNDTSLSSGMMNRPSSLTLTPGDLLGSNYMQWQTLPEQSTKSHSGVSDRRQSTIKGADPIPMQDLIKRVLQRKVDNLELASSILPIGNFRSRRVPYAVRHSSHVKKIVGTMAKQKTKEIPKSTVDTIDNKGFGQRRLRSHAKLEDPFKPPKSPERVQIMHDDHKGSSSKVNNTSPRLSMDNTHLHVAPQAGDDDRPKDASNDAANKRLRQRTSRTREMTGTKITLANRDATKHTLIKRTMQKSKPLPAIKSATSSKVDRSLTSRLIEDAVIKSKSRTSSGDDIIDIKTAQSEALQKLGDMGEQTLLGTPRRFTHKMVRFKNDLGRVDKLSAIDEDKQPTGVKQGSSKVETASRPKTLKSIMSNSSTADKTIDVG